MNPYLQFGLTLGGQLLIAAFVYGQLTQRQKDQGGWIKKHETRLDDHDERLLDHEGRIAHIEGHKGLPLRGERG